MATAQCGHIQAVALRGALQALLAPQGDGSGVCLRRLDCRRIFAPAADAPAPAKPTRRQRHGPHRRSRPARADRGTQHHPPARPRPQAGASAQARRHADRRRRCPSLRERVHGRHPALRGERRAPPARDRRPRQGPRLARAERGGRVPGHGRAHHALSHALIGEDRAGKDARRAARPSLDGRHERRLFLPVPDADARHRAVARPRDGDRAVLGLQPLAHREGAAGGGRALLFHAEPAAGRARRGHAPDRDLRRTARASPDS